MFDRFATIEDEFEHLEKMIADTASDIDRQIQHEIDVRVGNKKIGTGEAILQCY